jgi:hypothetical protein
MRAIFALVISTLAALSSASAQYGYVACPKPPGSYADSCNECSAFTNKGYDCKAGIVNCTGCQTGESFLGIAERNRYTSFERSKCPSDHYSNDHGNLVCDPR